MINALKQPPPRGCVLKHANYRALLNMEKAAASARLCVETMVLALVEMQMMAAASARLCVETLSWCFHQR